MGTFQGEKFSRSQALKMTATHSKGISQKLSSDLANMLLSEMEANNKDESKQQIESRNVAVQQMRKTTA